MIFVYQLNGFCGSAQQHKHFYFFLAKSKVTNLGNHKLKGKRKKWVKISTEKDVYVNLICQKCGREITERFHCLIKKNTVKVYCKTCGKREIIKNPDFQELDPEKISKEFICEFLNGNKECKLFVHGNDLYIDFTLLIRNYRDKVEFCNI